MDSLARKLEQAFSALTRWQNVLSDHWRRHTNRRTMIVIFLSAALFLYLWLGVLRPPERFPMNELVSVPQGESLQEIADTLHENGVIRSPLAFRALMTMLGRARTAQAGDYLFKEPRDLFSIVRAMSIGAFGLEPLRIRVPEGASVAEMARIFSTQLERFNAQNFVAQAQPQEGYLFPDTYYFLPNANESIVLQTLRQNFDAQIAAIQPDIDASGHTLSDIVIMASILEREAYNTKDRKLISGVLWNRIGRDMPLQVDAVFAYTLGKGTFDLTMADLTSDSPYNTYKFKGLPPTPIGAPSLDSLEAALHPTENDYLYFLADKRGVTHYCKTYACQLANKDRYF
jgi:UPF0755 protein